MRSHCVQGADNSTRRRTAKRALWLALVTSLAAFNGCQALVPSALPGGFAVTKDARIAKQAKVDSFPTPADVGLASATSVP
jgi:hypothetical protein